MAAPPWATLSAARLAGFLIDEGRLDRAAADAVLALPTDRGRSFEGHLVEAGHISEVDLALALAKLLQLPAVDLTGYVPAPGVASIASHHWWYRGLVVLLRRGRGLTLGLSTPTVVAAAPAGDLALLTGTFACRAVIATVGELRRVAEASNESRRGRCNPRIMEELDEGHPIPPVVVAAIEREVAAARTRTGWALDFYIEGGCLVLQDGTFPLVQLKYFGPQLAKPWHFSLHDWNAGYFTCDRAAFEYYYDLPTAIATALRAHTPTWPGALP